MFFDECDQCCHTILRFYKVLRCCYCVNSIRHIIFMFLLLSGYIIPLFLFCFFFFAFHISVRNQVRFVISKSLELECVCKYVPMMVLVGKRTLDVSCTCMRFCM